MRESEFDIFEAENASMIQGRPVYWSEKSKKCDFSLQYIDLPWISEAFLNFGKKIEIWSKNWILARNRILSKKSTFASIHNMPSLNQGRVFSLQKCQILHMFLPLADHFQKKIFEKFFTWVTPSYCVVVAPQIFSTKNQVRTRIWAIRIRMFQIKKFKMQILKILATSLFFTFVISSPVNIFP